MGAILAVDVGEARIGLARAEAGSTFAFGRGYLTSRGLERDLEAIKEKAEEEGAELVVVGLPRRLGGTDSPQTEKARAFAAALARMGLKVALEDERLTSRLAAQGIRESGARKKRRQEKGLVDERAAVLILESYLARQAYQADGR
jgi:putative holliday junction resolvase